MKQFLLAIGVALTFSACDDLTIIYTNPTPTLVPSPTSRTPSPAAAPRANQEPGSTDHAPLTADD